MCKMKSGIILKDRVFIPDYDGHTQMLEELKIEDTAKNAKALFVRAELYPKDGDIFSDIDTWEFNVDQDITPEWFVPDYEKTRMIESVKAWAQGRIFINTDDLALAVRDSASYYLKNCSNATIKTFESSNATIKTLGSSNATIETWGRSNATIETFESSNATIKTLGSSNATIETWESSNATIETLGSSNATIKTFESSNATIKTLGSSNATIETWGRSNATIETWESSNATIKTLGSSNATIKTWGRSNATIDGVGAIATIPNNVFAGSRKNIILLNNATLKDCKTNTIYQSGDWKLVEVNESEAG